MYLVSVWDPQLFPRSSVVRHERHGVSHKLDRQSQMYPVSHHDILTLHVPTGDYDNKRIVFNFRESVSLRKQFYIFFSVAFYNHDGIKYNQSMM